MMADVRPCSGQWNVIRSTTLANRLTELEKPSTQKVIRIHHDELIAGFSYTAAITTCYQTKYNFYGLVDGPDRVDCPPDAK